jgi:hypothetical protein
MICSAAVFSVSVCSLVGLLETPVRTEGHDKDLAAYFVLHENRGALYTDESPDFERRRPK